MKFMLLKYKLSSGNFLVISNTIILVLLMLTGLGVTESARIILVLATQWIPGVYFWNFLTKKPMSIFMGIGIGGVFGFSFSILASIFIQAFLGLNWGWVLPFTIWIFMVGINLVKKKSIKLNFTAIDLNDVKWIFIGLLPGILYIIGWWLRNPVEWQGKRNFYIDLPYNEAVQNSVSIFWPPQNLMSSGSGLRYHWFSHLWAGRISEDINLQSFVAQTRLMPIFALVSLGYLTYAFCRESLLNQKISAAATAVSVGGIAISNLNGGNYEKSPSLFLSLVLILGIFYLITNLAEPRTKPKTCVYFIAIFLLFMTAIGTKGSSGPILLSGVTLALIHNVLTKRITHTFALLTFSAYLIGFLIMFKTLFQGTTDLQFGLHLNWLALISTTSSLLIGLLALKNIQIRSTEIYFIMGCIISGSVLSMLFWNVDGAQNYFIIQSLVVAIVPVFKGFQIATESLPKPLKSTRFALKNRLAISIILSFLTYMTFWILGENNNNRMLRGFSAVSAILVPILLLFRLKSKFNGKQLIIVSISALLIGTYFQSGRVLIRDWQENHENSKNSSGEISTTYSASINMDHIEAGKWVKENIGKDKVMVTNRQCLVADAAVDLCDKRWFLASALTGRQIYNEGSTFNSKNKRIVTSFREREKLSSEIATNASLQLIENLKINGINYVWFDKEVPHNDKITKYLKSVFENQTVLIFKI
jgi:hypothetical protein